MKLRCIIVDDEPLALDILEDYIAAAFPSWNSPDGSHRAPMRWV